MPKPYLLVSDLHCHRWSAFSVKNPDGVNSRLRHILDELKRGAAKLAELGGNVIVIAGDIFHVRGSIDPEVFNPVTAVINELIANGFIFEAIPGNHDLASKETTVLGNAFTSLQDSHFRIFFDAAASTASPAEQARFFIPWMSTPAGLREKVTELKSRYAATTISESDLIIHAGIDGVIDGLPAHGLTSAEVASWGFKRVFAGHYHHHKVMEDGKVISIGALTHQTWSDVQARAGFLIIDDDNIRYHATRAPLFEEITPDVDPNDYPIIAQGNFIRVRDFELDDAGVAALNKELLDAGALGVIFQIKKTAAVTHRVAKPKGLTLDATIAGYIDRKYPGVATEVHAAAASVLSEARALSD